MKNKFPDIKEREGPSWERMGAIRKGEGKGAGQILDLPFVRLNLPPQHQMPLPGKRKRPENAKPSEHMKKKRMQILVASCQCLNNSGRSWESEGAGMLDLNYGCASTTFVDDEGDGGASSDEE